jgi:cystathionine beta-synthase
MANKLMLISDVPHSLGDLLKNRGPRQLATISPKTTLSEAIRLFQSTGISQLPVLHDGKPVGSIQEVTLARILHDHSDPDQVAVGDVMVRSLPQLETTVHLDEAYRLLLAGNSGVLATQDGQVIDIITRIDLVHYWNQMRMKKT